MAPLHSTINIRVRFSEVDSINMVWHGHYPVYLEDAREEFGRQHGLSYSAYIEHNILAPIADMHIQYKATAHVDDILAIEITYRPCRSSKLIFDYRITRPADGVLIATASTTQLFTDLDGNLILSTPDYIERWRQKNGV